MTRYHNVDGERIAFTEDEESQQDAKEASIAAARQANAYQEARQAEYPSVADQLDQIYHSGLNAWKATIRAIKDKYPKPEGET